MALRKQNPQIQMIKKLLNQKKKRKVKLTPAMMAKLIRNPKKSPVMQVKSGGAIKKNKFPDLSGDGKITKKDILMGRGIIKKKTKKKAKK